VIEPHWLVRSSDRNFATSFDLRVRMIEEWMVEELSEPAAVVCLEPNVGQPFCASIVVTLEPIDPNATFDDWQATTETQFATTLQRYMLIDLERAAMWGRPAVRRLGTHLSPVGMSVTFEQWCVAVGDCGITITCSAGTPVYPEYRHLWFEVIRDSVLDLEQNEA